MITVMWAIAHHPLTSSLTKGPGSGMPSGPRRPNNSMVLAIGVGFGLGDVFGPLLH